MKKQIKITETDPFNARDEGFYYHTGLLHWRESNGAVATLYGADLGHIEDVEVADTGGGIRSSDLIRIMKISAHIGDPEKVKDL